MREAAPVAAVRVQLREQRDRAVDATAARHNHLDLGAAAPHAQAGEPALLRLRENHAARVMQWLAGVVDVEGVVIILALVALPLVDVEEVLLTLFWLHSRFLPILLPIPPFFLVMIFIRYIYFTTTL